MIRLFKSLPLVALLALGLAVPAEGARKRAPAAKAPLVGVADQSPATFADPLFRDLGVRHTRLIVAWNAVLIDPTGLDAWIAAAREAGAEPLIAFNHADGDACPATPCSLPSVAAYRRAFKAFRARYPDVRSIQPWNEANHQSQPTARNPRRAAEYYLAAKALCRGCKVVAADVLDSTNMERWLAGFRRRAPKARLWGLHNYTDTNRFRLSGTERLLSAVPGEVWLTETGGIHRFETTDGRVPFQPSESRAARAVEHVFRIASTHRRRITRLYLYQWRRTNDFDRFDAGFVDPVDGRPRRAYHVLRRLLRRGGVRPLPNRETPKGPKPDKPAKPPKPPKPPKPDRGGGRDR
ncbi:MAG TPA: glycosyl hydrolase [Thermoleophilaceae bacterium]|nr:glycosyl hydrolase [Thermoleophilaceae bacterium]